MPHTTTEMMLHGTPLRIWSALTDPDHRRAWKPLARLDDPARLGDTRSAFAVEGWTRPVRAAARIDRLDKPHVFAWSCGIHGVFRFIERYDLSGDDGGARLVHTCTLTGVLSYPLTLPLLPRLRTLMGEADDRLADYLRWRVGQASRGTDRQRLPRRYTRRSR